MISSNQRKHQPTKHKMKKIVQLISLPKDAKTSEEEIYNYKYSITKRLLEKYKSSVDLTNIKSKEETSMQKEFI